MVDAVGCVVGGFLICSAIWWVWFDLVRGFACGCCSLVVRCLLFAGEWFVWCTGYSWALLLVVGVGVCFGVLAVALVGGGYVRFGWFLMCLLVGWLLWFLGFMMGACCRRDCCCVDG